MENNKNTNIFSQEKICNDIEYAKAQQITELLLNCGLISLLEYNKLCELNLKSFSPIFEKIMPNLVDNNCV